MSRHPTSGKRILNESFCVDDFGNLVFMCQYTNKPVAVDAMIFIGPCVPQVTGTYVCHPDARDAYKESKRLFDESEANCNTCRHLVRAKHAPRKDGRLKGSCHVNPSIAFHPEDWMGMPCYEQRTKI